MPYISPTELSNLQGKIDTLDSALEQMTKNAEGERLKKDGLMRACRTGLMFSKSLRGFSRSGALCSWLESDEADLQGIEQAIANAEGVKK